MYTHNAARIPNVDYPPSIIIGTWASMGLSAVQTTNISMESKCYYELQPNGRGKLRQANMNRVSGASISMVADITWKYLGGNNWMIILPPSTEYRVVASNNMTMGYRGSVALTARYYNGNVYVTPGNQVWVKADREHVAQLANRLRNQPRVHLDIQ